MPHVVLLGDSIFDNGAYTRGGPDVTAHLRALLPAGWRATLCAVDGATTRQLPAQLARVPADATHLVVSVGGNDALQNSDLLSMTVRTTSAALLLFADRLAVFERAYAAALDAVARGTLPVVICTIYNGALEPDQAVPARMGLALFNDVIIRAAITRGVDIIELRTVCTEPGDYANPIEPSDSGGRKIAQAIVRAIGAVESTGSVTRAWAGRSR